MSVLLIVQSEVHREKLLKIAEKLAEAKDTKLYVLEVKQELSKTELKEVAWFETEGRLESTLQSLDCT